MAEKEEPHDEKEKGAARCRVKIVLTLPLI